MCNEVPNILFQVAPIFLSCLLEGGKREALLKSVHLTGCGEHYQVASFKHGGTVCWLMLNMARASPPTQENSNCAVRNSICLKDSIHVTSLSPCAVAWKRMASHFNKLQTQKRMSCSPMYHTSCMGWQVKWLHVCKTKLEHTEIPIFRDGATPLPIQAKTLWIIS